MSIMDCKCKPMLHVSPTIQSRGPETVDSVKRYSRTFALNVMIKSVSIIAQYQYNPGNRLRFPVFKIGHYHTIADL